MNVNDAIQQTVTDTVDTYETGIYANQQKADAEGRVLRSKRGDSADEVDPRKLVRDPTISELRWYYRRTIGKVLVEKPIRDVFKNGFDFRDTEGEGTPEEARSLLEEPTFMNGEGTGNYLQAYVSAQIKARRDGFALCFLVVEDDADGPHVSPVGSDVTVDSIPKVKVWTIDRLSSVASGEAHNQIQDTFDVDKTDYDVRDTGIVVDARVDQATYREPLGYIVDSTPTQFVHRDRVMHYTWRANTDHNYKHGSSIPRYGQNLTTLGPWEGDSILLASYDLLKGLSKGNWAIMQALFRNAAHLYAVKAPENVPDQEWQATNRATSNISSKSALTFPSTDYEMDQFESGNELDPEPHYDAIFDQLCAVHEMTRSVLFGTQAGTVSGSEVDIKNYFNKIERLRNGRVTREILDYVEHAKRIKDGRTSHEYAYNGVEIEFGPLFKMDEQTRIQTYQTAAQAATTLIGQYAMTPDEARQFLSNEFVQIDLDDLSEQQMDELDRIRLATSGQSQGAIRSENEYTEGPEMNSRTGGEEGGRPQREAGSQAAADSLQDKLDEYEADE